MAFKVAPILAQYLYTNKRLELPGIGVFLLDPSVNTEVENNKQNKSVNLEGVSFEYNPATKESPELIAYISSNTGKMKALASSDLESHLELAQQFLNIGKPFLFEGIGTLTKTKSGELIFTSGQLLPEKMREHTTKETTASYTHEEPVISFKSVLLNPKAKWKKPVAALLVLAGIVIAVLGGYIVYKKSKAGKETIPVVETKPEETKPQPTEIIKDTAKYLNKDTVAAVPVKKDSIIIPPVQNTTPSSIATAGNYKYVLEIAGIKRAFFRYEKLKHYQWPVQMETKDSVSFKLFMVLPTAAADTMHIRDSLTAMNGRKVHIEQ